MLLALFYLIVTQYALQISFLWRDGGEGGDFVLPK